MKLLLSLILLTSTLSISAADTQAKTHAFTTEEMLFESFKNHPNESIKGPFLLKIKSISKDGINTHLNTQADPKDPMNITVVMPPAIKNHYQTNFKSDLSTLFLNSNLVIKGKLTWENLKAKSPTKNEPENPQKEGQTKPVIKLFFNDQLAHYD